MRILLVVDPARPRPWIRDFADDLRARGFDVRRRHGVADPPSTLLRLVFELDRLLVRPGRVPPPESVTTERIAPLADADFRPDVVVDLGATPVAVDGVPTLAIAFGGAPGETALYAALTRDGGAPVEIYDVATAEILERARPSLEGASGLVAAAGTIAARAAGLLLARLVAADEGRIRPRLAGARLAPIAPLRRTIAFRPEALARSLARSLARHVYHLVCRAPHWRVGWRFVDGPGLADTGSFDGPAFRVVPDPGLRCFADPFVLTWKGETHVLVEDFDHRRGKASISALRFDAAGPIGPAVPVLEVPWHLSFPHPIVLDGELYLMPESSERRDLTLYRCIAFPDRWEPVATLLEGVCASDATVIRRGERWWMFSTVEDGRGGWSDRLAIHSAPSLFGPWTPHRDVPLLVDAAAARPAGRPFERDGRLFRTVQDCSVVYGGGIDVVEVTRLDDEGYEQKPLRRIRSGPAWPGGRVHTLDRVGRLEVIDGIVPRPRWEPLNRLVEPLFAPGGER